MKNRSQPFECAIAGKLVGISLRHGGGLQEPEHVYVRCDERDCQYADLNEPPCPLRIDMFADGSDRQVLEYFTLHPGVRVCYACLTVELSVSHDQVRRASWRLKEESGFSIRPSRCGLCHHRRVTIGGAPGTAQKGTGTRPGAPPVVAQEPALDPTARGLETYLRRHTGYSFCTHCLARELRADLGLMRDAMWAFDQDPAFLVRTAQCVSCLLTKRVIRHQEPSSEISVARRVIEFFAQSAPAVHCAPCVAFSTDLGLADVRRVLSDLEGVTEFERREAPCAACGRWQSGIAMRPADEVAPERLDEVGALLEGLVRYRKLRIDPRSFRTAQGWRPFAFIKTWAGAIVPNAPAILLGLASSKLEADELAVQHAREWIDKTLP